MTKCFIPLSRGKRLYKLNTDDIGKIYKIVKRILP